MCRRVNAWRRLHGKENALCVSIHFNAYGNGSVWTPPSGWSIYTSVGNTAADKLADCIGMATTIIASQLPYEKWYDVITEKTFADAIMDRLINSSHKIILQEESMRKKK